MATDLKTEIIYPSSDGKPMADNTRQWEWIATVKNGLDVVFDDRQDVFVASDLLWYPVEGEPQTVTAPDILVAFGRPKGHRMSYMQWKEDDIAPQVVFEILSHSNDIWTMADKYYFYENYAVEEYYIFDPLKIELRGFLRRGSVLRRIPGMNGFASPRLGVRFEVGESLSLYGPDGRKFTTYLELDQQRRRVVKDLARSESEVERLRRLLANRGIDPNATNGSGG